MLLLDDEEWAWFLDAHPELRGWLMPAGTTVYGNPYPEKWMYYDLDRPSDQKLLDALARCVRRSGGETVSTRDVACALWGPDALDQDMRSIAPRLLSLSTRGLLRRVGRRPARWAPLGGEA